MVVRMLDQANYWVSIAGTAIDAVLLGRVLQLRLQRVYLFITLACVLVLLFDVVDIWVWSDSNTRVRVFLYSRFLFALVYPLVGWDVFEEMGQPILKLRRVAAGRLISGLVFATIFGFIVGAFIAPSDGSGEPSLMATLGLIAWAGSVTATLGFLWSLRRMLRSQKISVPRNTSVWMTFWQLVTLAEVASCFCLLIVPLLKNDTATDLITLVLLVYDVVIGSWCILKLRPVQSDVPSPSANANV